jgi:hypothetical protein
MSNLDFDLRILKAGSNYLVDARSPDGEEANRTFELPISPERLDELFRGLGHVRKATRGGRSPEVRQAREVGRQLFETVFAGDIRDVFQRSLGRIEARGGDLRIRLRLAAEVPELLDLPWELLFDRGRNCFLALERATTLVRHLPVQQRIEPMRIAPPLRILVAISNPGQGGYAALDVEQEWSNLDQALRPLADRGLVSLTRLDGATQDSMRQALKRDTCHVLHFIGHGGYQPTEEAGFLVLEDGRGGVRPCSAARLTDLVREQPTLRLVVLNACEGGRSSRTDPFAGVAQSLVQGAMPAVVAMQFPVTDAAAVVFAGSFYGGLASGRPVDLALAEARREVNLRGEEGEIEWATPVLYMRGDGDLFSIDKQVDPKKSQPAVSPPAPGPPVSEPMDRYRVLAMVYRGRYSTVRKCVALDTGAVCVVKDTDVSSVSLDALEALTRLRCPNLASPTRLWHDGARVYEELPYVGGVRLSEAIAPGLGRMGGRVLETFHKQMMDALTELHGVAIVHRDVHPENIYLVAENVDSDSCERFAGHKGAIYGQEGATFGLRFVIVDHTFAVLAANAAAAAPVVHDPYTPSEQALGSPTFASDMYALGATIYYAITGQEVPDFAMRRLTPGALGGLPNGDHPSYGFSRHLAQLLALDESERPRSLSVLPRDTQSPHYSGTLRISPTQILITDSEFGPRILDRSEALVFFHSLVAGKWWNEKRAQEYKEVDYWIRELSARPAP